MICFLVSHPREEASCACHRFDENIPELEQHIRDTLDTLERQNYVHRTGDVYEYLTNDEQAIENEIKNVDVEDRQIRSRIGKIISGDILGSPQVNYGQGRQKIPFRYGLSIDGIAQSTQRPITLNIITPMDSAERDAKILQSAGIRDELRVILDDNPLLLRDIYTLERTEKYLKLHANEQGARKRIIDNKRDDLARMQVGLKATLAKALSAATLAYNGATLETTAREDAASVVTEGLQTLIGRLYTNLGMVDGLAYSEKDLPVVLADADATPIAQRSQRPIRCATAWICRLGKSAITSPVRFGKILRQRFVALSSILKVCRMGGRWRTPWRACATCMVPSVFILCLMAAVCRARMWSSI